MKLNIIWLPLLAALAVSSSEAQEVTTAACSVTKFDGTSITSRVLSFDPASGPTVVCNTNADQEHDCRGATIQNCPTIHCQGSDDDSDDSTAASAGSCKGTTISNFHTITCNGHKACLDASFHQGVQVQCLSTQACQHVSMTSTSTLTLDVTCNGPLSCDAATIETFGEVKCVNGGLNEDPACTETTEFSTDAQVLSRREYYY
jgi:hypothetical protein